MRPFPLTRILNRGALIFLVLLGGFATAIYAWMRHWPAVVPVPVLMAAVGIALVIGAVAGVYPAWRAARLAPAEALRMV